MISGFDQELLYCDPNFKYTTKGSIGSEAVLIWIMV